jgi:hypothetical protein
MILGEPRGPKTELRVSPEQTIETIELADLKLSKLVEVPPYHYGAVFERSAIRDMAKPPPISQSQEPSRAIDL